MHVVIALEEKDKVVCRSGSELSVAPRGTGDDVWSFENGVLKNGDYFLVVSDPFMNSKVELVHHSQLSEINLWKQNEDGAIYTVSEDGGKRYLWVLSKIIYANPDATMATHFKIMPVDRPHREPEPNYTWLWILVAVLLILALLFLKK